MRNRVNQIYEEYWKYTAAKTDFNSSDFLDILKKCTDFFDRNQDCHDYDCLQDELANIMCILPPSVRKMINQLVKIGFLKPLMAGYNYETKEYINANTERKRKSILSRIVYKYSNFNNSMTKPAQGQGQINFFIKTLEEVGKINDRQLTALMNVDVSNIGYEYLTKDQLDKIYEDALQSGFIDRKYNQIQHLWNLLSRLEDLKVHNHEIYFKTDADRLFGNEEIKKDVRDPYLQRIYKSELEEESCIHFECETPRCMLEGLAYPVLIASHIKPYSHCKNNEKEQFDINNGLLLSKNTDSLFDLGYMTFNDDGTILPSKALDWDISNYLSRFRLHHDFINPKRMEYMKYHKQYVFNKRFKSHNAKVFILNNDEKSQFDMQIVAEDLRDLK